MDCSYVCDVAVMPSCQGTGVGKQIVATLTAMAIFPDVQEAVERGYITES